MTIKNAALAEIRRLRKLTQIAKAHTRRLRQIRRELERLVLS